MLATRLTGTRNAILSEPATTAVHDNVMALTYLVLCIIVEQGGQLFNVIGTTVLTNMTLSNPIVGSVM